MSSNKPTADQLFNEARKLPQSKIDVYLTETCGNDLALLEQVRSMFVHEFDGTETLNPPDASPLKRVDFQLGEYIDKYKIHSVLGEGGMGIVYLAEQNKPVRRKVAIKVIKAGMDTKQVIARFEAERQALVIMNHPGIAQVYEAGSTKEGRPYFVLEYVKGMPITEACDEYKLNTKQRLELMAKVCDAVQHAHMKGIIHRDLKPGNILVSLGDDDSLVPKIIDFGVAKATGQQLTDMTLITQVGHFIGTPAYMSPEQADLNATDIDTRTDVYALGVILYELLTGVPPFDPRALRNAGLERMREIIRKELPPRPSTQLSSINAADAQNIAEARQTQIDALTGVLRKELEWIPLKALKKQRNERYNSSQNMGDDIRRYLSGEALKAGPDSSIYKLTKAIKRNKGKTFSIAGILLSLISGLSIALLGWAEADRQTKVSNQLLTLLTEESQDTLNPSLDSIKTIYDERIIKLQEFESDLTNSPVLAHVLGLTFQHLGRWHKNNPYTSEQEYAQALKYYSQAESIAVSLSEYPQDIAYAHMRIADLHKKYKKYPEALQNYLLAVSELEIDKKVANQPLVNKIQSNLFDVYLKLGELEKALPIASSQLEIARKQMFEDPTNLSTQRTLANRLQRSASVHSKIDKIEMAIVFQEEAIALRDYRFEYVKDLAWANYFLGEYFVNTGRESEGTTFLEVGLNTLQTYDAEHPGISEVEKQLSDYSAAHSQWINYLN
jgi:serine/threonine protein kinase